MCKDCGCGEHHHHGHGEGVHAHTGADGKVYYHSHEPAAREVPLEQAILAKNDNTAELNRAFLRGRGTRTFNLISSPGSGKTTLLTKTLEHLKAAGIPTAVIVGDQYGEIDADRMRSTGVPVTQVQVHDSCHLTAQQISAVLETAVPAGTKILFIENVGNLVCPVAFDLGEDEKIALLSTPEGEEKPLKYPGLFTAAKLVLLTKMDIADALGWNKALCIRNIRTTNPEAEILEVSSKTETGFEAWMEYLKHSVKQ
ncbi:MAG: hydrogenase nickel incorporation protein HypB [Lentisphaeria bacterium]|nr:hydrogenase nickel incorporation protein HypB [Lentisphaeria bacterium]